VIAASSIDEPGRARTIHRSATATARIALDSSTSRYRGEIFAPQQLALPRRKSHPKIGTLRNGAIGFPHAGQ
jgi:hypothetical protein